MASLSEGGLRPLSFSDIQELATGLAPSRVLPTLCLNYTAGDPPQEERILCYLVRCRSNGFLILLPGVTVAESALGGLIGDDGAELAVYKQVEVGLEDSRGRRFGVGIMFIADLSAECAFFFSRAPSLRGGRSPGGGELIRMKVGDAVARPASRGAWQVAEAWIAEQAGADELVQEYQTAESGVPNGEDEALASDSDAAEIISQLQARVQELEAQMPQVSRLGAGAPRAPVPPLLQAEPKRRAPGATELFSRAAGAVAPAALEQLKLMAGAAAEAPQPFRGGPDGGSGRRRRHPRPGHLCGAASRGDRRREPGRDYVAQFGPSTSDFGFADAADGSPHTEAPSPSPQGQHHSRLGQRRRQLWKQRREGLHSPGGLCEGHGGRGRDRPFDDGQRCGRHGLRLSPDRQWPDEAVCGAQNRAGGSPPADLPGSVHGLCVADVSRERGRVCDGPDVSRAHADRADFPGSGQMPICLAFECLPGTGPAADCHEPEEAVNQALCPPGRCSLGSRKHSISARPGLPGEPPEKFQACRSKRGSQERRRPSGPKTVEAEEEGEAVRQGGRLRRHPSLSSRACPGPAPKEMRGLSADDFGSPSRSSPVVNAAFSHTVGGAVNRPERCHDQPADRTEVFSQCTNDVSFDSFGAEPISFLNLMQAAMKLQEAAHVGLSSFLRLSMQPHSHIVHKASQSLDLLPCPIPRWSWTGPAKLSPHRRHRRKFLKSRAQLLQKVIGVLNWETLGHPVRPPPEATIGQAFTDPQWAMVCRLERLIDHFLKADAVSCASLGRSGEKFSSMMRVAKELPDLQEVDLCNLVQELSHNLDPYGKRLPHDSPSHDNLGFDETLRFPQERRTVTELKSSPARPVVASRIKWEHSPSFDPLPFFTDSVVRDAFVDPSSVKLPSHRWVDKPKGRVHCSRHELLKLAEKWDSKGACRIFRLDQIVEDEAVGVFSVPKDEQFDRLILNPQRVNARLKSFSHYTKSLAPGCLFALIRLEADQVLRISADDLAEMYYTIKIPELRAKRNCIGLRFDASELSHLQCFNPQIHVGTCFVALNALAMGDSWAVEFAQQAHHNVLKHVAGCMLDHQRVAYRKPFPRSSFLEWLSIDDHIGVQVISKKHFKMGLRGRDTEVFERATQAYAEVGLVQHPKKKKRGVQHGTFLGAEVDGVQGLVSAPRDRIGTLMLCTLLVVKRGCCSPALLSSLLGCWIHVLMFRRPILSVLSHSFSEGSNRPRNEVFMLSRQSRNELAALALLGPMCISDMRVAVAPAIYCTDASPTGGGICVCPEDPHVVAELWRHSEQRGFYAPLLNPAASVLAELGLDHLEPELPEAADWLDQPEIKVPHPLAEGIIYDCIELFRGEGNWSAAHAAAGFSVHGGLDVRGDSIVFKDLLDDSVFHELTALALRRVVRDWHAGPPCYTYGTLRRPRIRSKLQPAGFDLEDPLTFEQTRLALRTAFLMWLVVTSGLFFSVEQPVISGPVLRALTSLCILWQWFRFWGSSS